MTAFILNRRAFLVSGVAAGVIAAAPAFAQPPVRLALPGRRDVRLDDGPLATQFRYQQDLFLALDEDALLKPFRLRSGLAAPGADLGGWYDDSADFHFEPGDPHVDFHGFIAGHSFGQYVSGLARGFAVTGDTRAQSKANRLVDGYRATISPAFFDDYNLPAYTYDKLVCGLIDCHEHTGTAAAKPALKAVTEAALPYLPEKALTREERRSRPYKREAQMWDEPYTLPENLLLAYERGMGEDYRALGARFMQNDTLFGPLSRGENVLGGKHAYSHVNALSSAVQGYLTLGGARHLQAAVNGFSFVQAQSYASGGWGPSETLAGNDERQALYESLSQGHNSFETPCGAYGHFKIARHLLCLTGDSRYGDSMERVLYNTVLGAKPTEPDGRTFYYSDYNATAHKSFHQDRWPCCSGTFVQLTADYGISSYLIGQDSLYVTLYVPSRITAHLGGEDVSLIQRTDYPQGDSAHFTVALRTSARFTLALRIPAWAGAGTRVAVNGRALPLAQRPGKFLKIDRRWHDGDQVELALDQGMRLEALSPAHPELAALMRGPRALFAVSDLDVPSSHAELLAARSDGGDGWRVGKSKLFKPFTAITDESYRLYVPVTA